MQATRDSGREILPGYNADEPGGCYTIEALAGLLGTAEPAPNRSRNTAPTVRATVQAGDSCAVATIWDDCPAAEAPLEAFRAGDGMHNAAKDLSFLAGRRGYSADEIEAGLLEQLAGSEIHASRPERVQELLGGEMRSLAEAGERAARVAPNLGAVADFSAAEGGQPPEEGPVPLDARERMLDSIIYIEERDEYFDRYRRKRMTKRELNCRYNRVGPPSSNTASAAAVFDAEPAEDDPEGAGRRMTAARLTYRPGQPLRVVNEDGEREINIYTPSKVTPVPATDEDIEPWLAVVRHVFAEHTGHFCDYFGCVLQNPGRKINHTPPGQIDPGDRQVHDHQAAPAGARRAQLRHHRAAADLLFLQFLVRE